MAETPETIKALASIQKPLLAVVDDELVIAIDRLGATLAAFLFHRRLHPPDHRHERARRTARIARQIGRGRDARPGQGHRPALRLLRIRHGHAPRQRQHQYRCLPSLDHVPAPRPYLPILRFPARFRITLAVAPAHRKPLSCRPPHITRLLRKAEPEGPRCSPSSMNSTPP